MKSIVHNKAQGQYPRLMCLSSTQSIVLFTKPQTGTVVYCHTNGLHLLGQYSETWDMNRFEPFSGSVELEA